MTVSAARSDGTAATWTADQQYLDNDGASFGGGFDSADAAALTAAQAFVSGTQEQSLWTLFNN